MTKSIIFWNLVSVSLVGLFGYPILQFIITANLHYLLFLCGLVASTLITTLLKYAARIAVKDPSKHSYLFRPSGAFDCDLFCRDGDQSSKPGMPSGHMSTVAFFTTYVYLNTFRGHPWTLNKWIYVSWACTYVPLMAMARYFKKCHTPLQILVGMLMGLAVSIVLTKIVRHHDDKNKTKI